MVIQTLVLAIGLLATSETPAEPQKGWVVEVRGYTWHDQAKPPKGWVVELRGYTFHLEAEPKVPLILDYLWPQPKPELKVDRIDTRYFNDLSAVFGGLKVDVIEAQYHDDLRRVFEDLKKQKENAQEELARARREKAARVYEATLDGLKVPLEPGKKPSYGVQLETLYQWSRRWLEAEQDSSDKQADRLAALEAHLKRMKDLAKLAEVLFKSGEFSAADRDAAEFYRLEAEGLLKKGHEKR